MTVQERVQGSVRVRVQEQGPVRVRVQEQALVRQPAEPPERPVRLRFPFPGWQEEARRECLQLHFL